MNIHMAHLFLPAYLGVLQSSAPIEEPFPGISSKLGKQRKQHMFLKSRIHKTGNMGFQVLINMRPAYFGDSCSVTEDLMDQRAVDMRKQGARVRPSAKILTSDRVGVPRLGRDLDEVS